MVWVFGQRFVFETWCRQRGWSIRDRGIRHIPITMEAVVGFSPRPGDLVIMLSYRNDFSQSALHAETEFAIRKKMWPSSVGFRFDNT